MKAQTGVIWTNKTLPVLLLLMVNLLAQGASAEPLMVKADLDVAGVAEFNGHADIDLVADALLVAADAAPADLSFRLDFTDARIRVVNVPFAVIGSRPGGPGPWSFAGPMPAETVLNETGSGSIRLLQSGANVTLRVLPLDSSEPLRADIEDSVSFQTMSRKDWEESTTRAAFWAGRRLLPNGASGAFERLDANETQIKGAAYAFLFGGTFSVSLEGRSPRNVASGQALNASRSAADPTGDYGTWWYDRIAVVVEGKAVSTSVSTHSQGVALLSLKKMMGRLVGDVTLSGVNGTASVNGRNLPGENHLFQAIGDFETSADYARESDSAWSLSGPATFVGVNGATVAGNRNAHRWASTAVLGGAVGLAALAAAFFTHLGREALSFITGRNVAKPLESKHRLQFLRQIARTPGLTLKELAERNGLTKWGAIHHMAILKRASYVDEVRNGNVHTYMLNSHSYKFYAPALTVTPGRPEKVFVAEAMAELGHPKRRLIFDALVRGGDSEYAKLVRTWNEMGAPTPYPSPSDVTYHATKMEEAGLLVRRRQGAHVVWALNLDLEKVRGHQRRSYLGDPLTRSVIRILREQPGLDPSGVASALEASIRKPVERVREKLTLLEQAGLVVREGEGFRLDPESERAS